jgi:undecaprenyl-diphosphatase
VHQMSHLTYAEAMVVGLIQGATELFPLSSLGHNVLIPALVGGSWAQDLNVSKPESPYLAFIVGMHVATAIAMIIYFWRDWARIISAFFTSLWRREIATADQKLAWMIVVATIPVGIAGLALEHLFRVAFSKPIPTALFLAVNGLVLFGGERLRRREAADEQVAVRGVEPAYALAGEKGPGYPPPDGQSVGRHASGRRAALQQEAGEAVKADGRLSRVGFGQALILGVVQVFALLPGISRDGIVMVGGMFRGLSRRDAARFSFLLSAPVILAAGALKIPDLMGPLGNGIRGQVLAGSILSGVGAYLALRLFIRWLQNAERTLAPFAIYCLIVGLGSAVYLALR